MRDGSVWRAVKRSDPRNQPSERLSPGRSAMKQDGLAEPRRKPQWEMVIRRMPRVRAT